MRFGSCDRGLAGLAWRRIALATVLAAPCCAARMAAAADVQTAEFRGRVAPLLAARCGGCHGPAKAESGFRIDVRDKAVAGGDSGETGIVPGKPEESEIVERISSSDEEAVMPADGEPLSPVEQELVRAWVAAGAPWPDDLATLPEALLPAQAQDEEAGAAKAASHWAYQPVVRPDVPRIPGGRQPENPIDAFIAARLAEKNLAANPEADPRTLIRRV